MSITPTGIDLHLLHHHHHLETLDSFLQPERMFTLTICPYVGESGLKSTTALAAAPYPKITWIFKVINGGVVKYPKPGSVISTPITLPKRLKSAVTSDNPSVLFTIPPIIALPAPPIPSPPKILTTGDHRNRHLHNLV